MTDNAINFYTKELKCSVIEEIAGGHSNTSSIVEVVRNGSKTNLYDPYGNRQPKVINKYSNIL